LYERYLNKTASSAERQELAELLSQPACMEEIKTWIGVEMEQDATEGLISPEQAEEVFRQVIDGPAQPEPKNASLHRFVHFINRPVVRYAAAVLLLLPLSYYLFTRLNHKEVALTSDTVAMKAAIMPGRDKAVLTLADGTTIMLDSAANGQLTRQGNTQVIKRANGQLTYQVTGSNNSPAGLNTPVGYNTMTTPRGGQYQLQLPDGTKVWLNAASSITYPTLFAGGERRIEVRGEAYFEVVKDPKMPFRVSLPDQASKQGAREIEVLGTHFNVNGYPDEPALTITLLEGAVKIDASVLKPGEAYSNGKVKKVNTEEAVAWKNGYFQFDQADIRAVLRQIARWYDVEVRYEGKIPERKFGGEIQRDSNLSDVLKGLELSQVHFRLEGRTLTIIP
jgi:ferric-dicitrate binding protein FerR (iron transport regulator)